MASSSLSPFLNVNALSAGNRDEELQLCSLLMIPKCPVTVLTPKVTSS